MFSYIPRLPVCRSINPFLSPAILVVNYLSYTRSRLDAFRCQKAEMVGLVCARAISQFYRVHCVMIFDRSGFHREQLRNGLNVDASTDTLLGLSALSRGATRLCIRARLPARESIPNEGNHRRVLSPRCVNW